MRRRWDSGVRGCELTEGWGVNTQGFLEEAIQFLHALHGGTGELVVVLGQDGPDLLAEFGD